MESTREPVMGDTDDRDFLHTPNQILKMAAIMLVVFVLGVLTGHYWLP